MSGRRSYGAGQLILVGAALAILLLWMDGASHSVPTMIGISVGALVIFVYLRSATPKAPLTQEQRIEREREDAARWLAKSDHADSDVRDVEADGASERRLGSSVDRGAESEIE